MKLGKKKNTDETAEKEAKGSGKNGGKKKADAPKRKRLSGVAGVQAGIVLASGVLAAFLVFWLVLQPAEQGRYDQQAETEANMAVERLNQHLSTLQGVVRMASSPMLSKRWNLPTSVPRWNSNWPRRFRVSKRFTCFPMTRFPEPQASHRLGFAGLTWPAGRSPAAPPTRTLSVTAPGCSRWLPRSVRLLIMPCGAPCWS